MFHLNSLKNFLQAHLYWILRHQPEMTGLFFKCTKGPDFQFHHQRIQEEHFEFMEKSINKNRKDTKRQNCCILFVCR